MNHHILYRILSGCLFINNVAGVILNGMLTLVSLFFGIGVPGIIFLFMYGRWTLSPQPRTCWHYCIWSFIMGIYNYFISIYDHDHLSSFSQPEMFIYFYLSIFPAVNIGLCILLAAVALGEPLRNPVYRVYPYKASARKPLTEPVKLIVAFGLGFLLIVIILFWVFFASLTYSF